MNFLVINIITKKVLAECESLTEPLRVIRDHFKRQPVYVADMVNDKIIMP